MQSVIVNLLELLGLVLLFLHRSTNWCFEQFLASDLELSQAHRRNQKSKAQSNHNFALEQYLLLLGLYDNLIRTSLNEEEPRNHLKQPESPQIRSQIAPLHGKMLSRPPLVFLALLLPSLQIRFVTAWSNELPSKSCSISQEDSQLFAYDWLITFLMDLGHEHEAYLIFLNQISHDDFL